MTRCWLSCKLHIHPLGLRYLLLADGSFAARHACERGLPNVQPDKDVVRSPAVPAARRLEWAALCKESACAQGRPQAEVSGNDGTRVLRRRQI